MNKTELMELIRSRENSGVEFKRDDVSSERLAREIVGLLNLHGGHILLGVEDDGTVTGLTRDRGSRRRVGHGGSPYARAAGDDPVLETIDWEAGKSVGIVSLPANAPDKPYKVKRGSAWITKVRVGTTTRDATREEEDRLYQLSGRLQYGLKPVLGTGLDTFDFRRLRDYFTRILGGGAPETGDAPAGGRCS